MPEPIGLGENLITNNLRMPGQTCERLVLGGNIREREIQKAEAFTNSPNRLPACI